MRACTDREGQRGFDGEAAGRASPCLVVQARGGQKALALGPLSAAPQLLLVRHQAHGQELVDVKLGAQSKRQLHLGRRQLVQAVHAGGGRLHSQPVLRAGAGLAQGREQRGLALLLEHPQAGPALLLDKGADAGPRVHLRAA